MGAGLQRHRDGDRPEAGGHRGLHDLRARRRPRRRLAPQHLSRRGLRRALVPLLVLLRAAPRLEPAVLAAGGDPRLPPRHGAQARGDRPRADRHRGGARRVRRRDRALDAAHERGRALRGRRAGARVRPAQPAALAVDPGSGRVPRPLVPLGRVGPRLRPRRQARGGDRHRRERDPVRARRWPSGRRTWTSTSAARRTCCPATTASTRRLMRRAIAVDARVSRPRAATGCGRSWRRSWRGSPASGRSAGCCAPGRTTFMRQQLRTRRCAGRHGPTTRSAASGSCSAPTTCRRSSAPTWSS